MAGTVRGGKVVKSVRGARALKRLTTLSQAQRAALLETGLSVEVVAQINKAWRIPDKIQRAAALEKLAAKYPVALKCWGEA